MYVQTPRPALARNPVVRVTPERNWLLYWSNGRARPEDTVLLSMQFLATLTFTFAAVMEVQPVE